MKNRVRLLEVLKRAETGPMMEEKKFDLEVVAGTIRKLVKKYGLKFDRSLIVPNDDELADRLFEAGMECAAETGIFCQDTSRRIIWTRGELEEGLRGCISEAVFGSGNDTCLARTRRPEDNIPALMVGGVYGIAIPEDQFEAMYVSYAQESVIDIVEPGTLETVYGFPTKAASPWEVLAAWREFELSRAAVEKVGRPGMCKGCVENSPTALGGLAGTGYGGFTPSDWHHVSTISEMKTNYHLLSLATQTTRIGGLMEAYYNPIFGGYVGGAEGVAVAIVAGLILIQQTYMATTVATRPDHPFYSCDTTPELLWALSVGIQALARNTNLLTAALVGPVGGPGTKTMLYENAAFTVASIASGLSVMEAAHSAGGKVPKHCSGLDAKICGEVARAARGLPRGDANELVMKLLEKYEADIPTQPIGQTFEEVYDLKTVRPTPEWQGIYDEVREELIGMGLPLDRLT